MRKIIVNQGDQGRFRWNLYTDGKHRAVSTVSGYATRAQAVAAAREDFGEMVEITSGEGDEATTFFAGTRDWSD